MTRARLRSFQFRVVTGCWFLWIEKSRVSLAGSVGSGRKRAPHIEQAYSPVQTRLPSQIVITAFRQTFSADIQEAYIGLSAIEAQELRDWDRESHIPRRPTS